MKLTCIAIDDEPLALELLQDNISKIPFLELKAGFNKPLEAINYLNEHTIDLVFIDIQMPGISGLQFIKGLPKKALYILVTAYEQFALEGYNLGVVDYLLKPVGFDRFMQACEKAKELYVYKQQSSTQINQENRDYMFVQADYKMVKVNYNDIEYIEGLKDYVKFHLTNGHKPLVARLNMKTLEDDLPSHLFLRIHKSYIVSKKAITAVQKSTLFIGQTEIPVGENFKDQLKKFIG